MRINVYIKTSVFTIAMLSVASAHAQSQPEAAVPKTFEVASIKPSAPGGHGVMIRISPGGRFNAGNLTVKQLIEQAYGVRDFQITGAPGWVSTQHYDIEAKADVDGPISREQLRVMVQALLEDRCKLTLHRETKELPIYALVAARSGPKLKESQGGRAQMRMGRGSLIAEGVPVETFASELARQIGRSVVDKTGIKGNYDFKLEWTPDESESFGPREGGPGGPDAPPPPDPSGPTIFTAVQEQLGLKLESQKGPVEILVIDRVEKPSEN